VGQQGNASGPLLLGLDGLEVVSAELVGGERQLAVQTTATVVGCVGCGVRATPHGRRMVRVRDLPIGGRPVVLAWRKRLRRCREPACRVRTWTERMVTIRPRAVLTERARAEACRRVGTDAHAVAAVARDLGVGWATIMRAVADHGTPLVEDPARLDGVATLGLDETSFLKATRVAPTRWVTGLVDLEGGRLLDVVADRTRAAVDRWLGARSRGRLAGVATVALDPWRGYASALVVPAWPRQGGGGPLSYHPAGQHGGRPGPPADPAGHPRASGPQARSAVPHPQAAADRPRAAHPAGTGAAAGWAGGGGSWW
jgi:transposase